MLDGSREAAGATALALDDVDELQLVFPDWELEFSQLGAGRYCAEIQYVPLAGVECRWGRVNRLTQARGMTMLPLYSFTPITDSSAQWRHRGRQLRIGQVEIMAPTDPFDALAAADTEAGAIGVMASTLEETARVLFRMELADLLPAHWVHTPDLPHFQTLEAEIERVLALGREAPERLAEPHEAARIRARCLTTVCRLFEPADPPVLSRWTERERRDLAVRADDFIEQHLAEPLVTEDLCRHLGVGRVVLSYLFDEAFGSTPMTYVRLRRLNRIRAELKAADGRQATVADIAGRFGFRDPARFEREYRRHFGERPAQTLARRPGRFA